MPRRASPLASRPNRGADGPIDMRDLCEPVVGGPMPRVLHHVLRLEGGADEGPAERRIGGVRGLELHPPVGPQHDHAQLGRRRECRPQAVHELHLKRCVHVRRPEPCNHLGQAVDEYVGHRPVAAAGDGHRPRRVLPLRVGQRERERPDAECLVRREFELVVLVPVRAEERIDRPPRFGADFDLQAGQGRHPGDGRVPPTHGLDRRIGHLRHTRAVEHFAVGAGLVRLSGGSRPDPAEGRPSASRQWVLPEHERLALASRRQVACDEDCHRPASG